MKIKHSIFFLFVLFLFSSCEEDPDMLAFYKSQDRDPRIIGKWMCKPFFMETFTIGSKEGVSSHVGPKEVVFFELYTRSGEYYSSDFYDKAKEGEKYPEIKFKHGGYFYTKNDTLYSYVKGGGLMYPSNESSSPYSITEEGDLICGKVYTKISD